MSVRARDVDVDVVDSLAAEECYDVATVGTEQDESPESKTTWCTRGLWRYSRHPNYCGELVVWLGLYLLTVPTLGSLPSLVGCAASPAFITLLLLKVSGIPLAEQRMDEKFSGNSEYQDYKASTPVLFPVPW